LEKKEEEPMEGDSDYFIDEVIDIDKDDLNQNSFNELNIIFSQEI
jgi:hypothetical protein